MASGITVTIKLNSFYQSFLRNYFDRKTGYFKFPDGHDLSLKLGILISKQPRKNNRSCFYSNLELEWIYPPISIKKINDEDAFEIELPYNKYKNVLYYNHLSHNAASILHKHIISFYKMVFHEEMNNLRSNGFQKKECVMIFMETHKIDEDYYDRLIKDYQRYISRVINKRSRRSLKKNSKKEVI